MSVLRPPAQAVLAGTSPAREGTGWLSPPRRRESVGGRAVPLPVSFKENMPRASPGVKEPRSGAEGSSSIRVLLGIPGPALRTGLRQILVKEDGVACVDEALTLDEAVALAEQHPPDVVLVDAQIEDNGAFSLCRRLVALRPDIPVILLTALDWDSVLAESWKAGATGLVMKDIDETEYIRVVRRAAGGERLFTPEERRRIRAWEHAVGWRLAALTGREWDVLRLIARGKTNQELSEELVVTLKTVEKHVGSILYKLGVRFRAELLAFLLEHHLELWSRIPETPAKGAPLPGEPAGHRGPPS